MATTARVLLSILVVSALMDRQIIAQQADPQLATIPPGLHVTGRGEIKVAPDVALISLTLNAVDDDLIRVRQSSDKTAQAIVDFAKQAGADNDAFQVSRLDLSLDFSKQLNRQIYRVSRDATVKLTDFSKLDGLLADLLKQQNLTVNKITFDTTDGKKLSMQALSEAITDARKKAELLATQGGGKLGRPINIHIDEDSQRPFVTSVIPTVGSNEDPATSRQRTAAIQSQTAVKDQTAPLIVSPFRLVANEVPVKAAVAADNGVVGKHFAIGQITTEAMVEVDYELLAK